MRERAGEDGWTTRRGAPVRGAAVRTLLLTWAVLLALLPPLVGAQSTDIEPPLIEHEVIEHGEPGVPQEFTASVVDDRALAEVLLFHRFAGSDAFDGTPMRRLATSSVYTASVATTAGDTRSIEYYIEARDMAGNRVIKGYAFSPLVRHMGGDDALAERAESGAEPAPEVRGSRRWLYIGLGVLLVGGALALAGDSGSTSPPVDTFTLTVDPPR